MLANAYKRKRDIDLEINIGKQLMEQNPSQQGLSDQLANACKRKGEIDMADIESSTRESSISMSNEPYQTEGRLQEAVEKIAGFSRILGNEHPRTLTIKENLAPMVGTLQSDDATEALISTCSTLRDQRIQTWQETIDSVSTFTTKSITESHEIDMIVSFPLKPLACLLYFPAQLKNAFTILGEQTTTFELGYDFLPSDKVLERSVDTEVFTSIHILF